MDLCVGKGWSLNACFIPRSEFAKCLARPRGGAGLSCVNGRFVASGSSLRAFRGHLVALWRTRNWPILYDGKGCRRNVFFNPRSEYVVFRGRPMGALVLYEGKACCLRKFGVGAPGAAARARPHQGRAGSA